MKILIYISVPLIAALIGWITNYIAVKMIFRPRKEINLLGIKIIGLIPKRKANLAEKIAETVEQELISHRDIKEIIQSAEFHTQASTVIRSKIENFINTKTSNNTLLTLFVSPDIVSKLSATLMEELEKEIPGMIDSLFQNVESKLDFRKIIRDKIMGYDLSKLESIIYSIASRELKAIEYLGGVLGFIVGLIQLVIILFGELHV
jgi:uncharacterized membrane protein YheB (UPF0754 family)